MAWKQNIIEDFKQLVSFDSISFHERNTADWMLARLKSMGFSVEEDQAGAYYGGDTGNIFAVLDGELEGDPVIFCAHMDVVEPGSGKKYVLEKDGTIHSAGDTVLGADDISGILEAGIEGFCYWHYWFGNGRMLLERPFQEVLDSGKPHKKIEILFTIGEELYVKGSDVFDYSKVTAKQAYVLDLSGAVGTAARRAPSIISVRAEIRGKAAHAGFEPERVVVERNLEIVPKEQLAQVIIQDEDVIEVLRFVGGG